MNMTQAKFKELQEKHPDLKVIEVRKLTIITGSGALVHEVGKNGITRIISSPFYDRINYNMLPVDRYLTFKGEELHSEIRGRPTVEIEYLKTDNTNKSNK